MLIVACWRLRQVTRLRKLARRDSRRRPNLRARFVVDHRPAAIARCRRDGQLTITNYDARARP